MIQLNTDQRAYNDTTRPTLGFGYLAFLETPIVQEHIETKSDFAPPLKCVI